MAIPMNMKPRNAIVGPTTMRRVENMSGLNASVVLAYFHTLDKTIREAVTWPAALCVFAGVIVLGMLICFTAAVFAFHCVDGETP